jgi:hypothetical protein
VFPFAGSPCGHAALGGPCALSRAFFLLSNHRAIANHNTFIALYQRRLLCRSHYREALV